VAPVEPGRVSAAGPKRELQLAVLLCLLGAALVLLAGSRPWLVLVQDAQPAFAPRRTPVSGRDLEPGIQGLGFVGLAGVVALSATRRSGRILVGLLLLASGVAVLVLLLPDVGHLPQLLRTRRLGTPGTRAYDRVETGFWPYAALVGGLLLALAGLLVTLRGRRWAALSRRYEVPAARADTGARSEDRASAQGRGAGAAEDRSSASTPVSEPGPDPGSEPGSEPGSSPADRGLWDALDRGEDPTSR